MINEAKKTLRKEMKAVPFFFENKGEREARMTEEILKSEAYRSCETLLLFAGKGTEPDLKDLFLKAIAENKTVGYPKCLEKGEMRFYRINDLTELKSGKYGIMEPSDECEEITDFKNTLCITPAVAYTKNLKRLGHGGGYYDRFLSKHPCKTVGVIFNEYIAEDIPQDENDINVDALIFA